jgi:uncharacterized membrane protein YbhN (UPF0104 family)
MRHVASVVAVACVLAAGLVTRPATWRTLARALPGRLGAQFEPLADPEALGVMRRPEVMAGIVGTQLVRLLLMFSASYSLFRALDVAVPLTDIVTVNSVARLFSLLPISISGLGVREGVQTWLFHQVSGIDAAAVVAMGIWMNVITYGLAGLIHLASALRGAGKAGTDA